MTTLSCALALLSGVIGAGFASGREIAYFFSSHGTFAPLSALCACAALLFLFCRLPGQLVRAGHTGLGELCRSRFGDRFGRLCTALFALLCAVTGGAMLAACAELAALTLPVHGAYAMGMAASFALGIFLAAKGLGGLAFPGAALCALLPILLLRMLTLPAGEAAFSPVRSAMQASMSGVCYGALNAAMLAGAMPLLLPLSKRQRFAAVALFTLLFCGILSLAIAVLARHRQAAFIKALPLVYLSNQLGKSGYILCALAMYAAALSTLCAMLAGLAQLLPTGRILHAAMLCLLFALLGFNGIITRGYPVLGALCTALMALLCLPDHHVSSSAK